MGNIILAVFAIYAIWVVRRDIRSREGISPTLWIPTLWVGILATRPVSVWLGGFDSGESSLEGSSTDALAYFVLIFAAMVVCMRRQVDWGELIENNKAILLFYMYFLISVSWSEHSFSAFKRLFKDFGNLFIILVILTEDNPREAIKSIFVRLGYVLIPLSYVFVRWVPQLGRNYNIHSGAMEAVGVTMQKNSLGAMILTCGLVMIFDLVDRTEENGGKYGRLDFWLRWATLGVGIYLLRMCDSKTSLVCLALGGGILLCCKLRLVERHLGMMAKALIVGTLCFMALDSIFHIKDAIFRFLGRDSTMTGRTEVWQYLLDLHTNPIFGMGFCTIWDSHFRANFPVWMADSAHNGYLEMYLDGGWIGVAFLVGMLFAVYMRAGRRLDDGDRYSVFRFAIILITIVYNISESIYARISPGWFLFLLAAYEYRDAGFQSQETMELVSEEDPAFTKQAG